MDGTTHRKRKKILPSYNYRQLFQSPKGVKLSDSTEGRRQERPCTNRDNGGTNKTYVTEDVNLHKEQSACAKDCAERTSKFDQGGIHIDLKEATSGTPELLNTGKSHPEQKLSSSSVEDLEKLQKKKDLHNKLSTLPLGCDTSYMVFVNKLCDFWSKGQNALINDEQVQVSHIIHFMSTLLSNVSRPFLVIAPSSSISKWQAEFSIVASSINVVAYNGNRNARQMIRMLEFFEDGRRAKFEVLLSTLDIITEDLEFLKCFRWETVIMDECIKSEILAEPLFLKDLARGSMILIWMDQINENTIDYCNKLSLLKCSYDVEGHQVASNSSISLLREELSPFIVSGPRSVSSKLVEYWVPVQMSNLQLEQYCSSLLTNLTALCSKNDPVGILNEILITARKSCDHPYTIDPTLIGHLIEHLTPGCSKEVQPNPETLLAIGVPSSGKLYLLDAILPKMKDQGQRVIILFKGFSLGHILEDFVRLTFGEDSYERVDGGGVPSHKQASVTKFNKEKGRFIFLLETGACSSSIKVSSVDAVVIFSSDWNPFNDIKALQKIKMDSESDINVFRLYTMCTIEEKVLLLSTRNILLESKLQNINFNTCHMLLTWGASYLFRKLDGFHDCDGCLEIWPQNSDMKDILQEMTSPFLMHNTGASMKFISSAWQNGASYSKDVSLFGEQYSHLTDGESACIFWKKLLDARQPRWRLLPLPSGRKRKQIKHYDGSSETNVQPDEAIKRQKTGNTNGESLSPRVCKEVGKEPGFVATSLRNEPQLSDEAGSEIAFAAKSQTAVSLNLCDQQKCHQQVIKPDMGQLFLTLGLKEDIQQMAERFLKYMMTNQQVIRKPGTALQAFQISVCWIAASILNEKLDHVESLSLAREHLNFKCGNDEAEYAFSNMRYLVKMFMRLKRINHQTPLNLVTCTGGLESEVMIGIVSESAVPMQQLKEKVAEGLLVQEGWDKRVLAPGQTIEQTEEVRKYAKKVKKKCEKKAARLIEDKRSEVEKLEISLQGKKDKCEIKYKHVYGIICNINNGEADKSEKLKNLEAKHRQKLDKLNSDMATALKDIEANYKAKQEGAVKESDCMLERFNSWIKSGLSDRMRSKETFDERGVKVVPVSSSSLSGNNLKEGNANDPSSAYVQLPLPQTPEPHNDAENFGSAEVAAFSVCREGNITNNDAISQFPPTSANNAGETIPYSLGVQGIHVLSAITTGVVEQIAISKNDQLSVENPALQTEVSASEEGFTSSERCTPSRMEQLDEACSSTHTESVGSPSTIKPYVVQSFTKQHQVNSPPSAAAQEHATSCNMLNQLNNQHVCVEASGIQNNTIQDLMPSSDNSVGVTLYATDQAGHNLPPEQAVPVDTNVSYPINLTQPCLASCGVTGNRLLVTSLPFRSAESRIQLDQRPIGSVGMTPHPSVDVSFIPALQNSFQFENSMSSRSLPVTISPSYLSPDPVIKLDPLQRELERISGELNDVSKTHEDLVSRLKLECDKEIEDLEAVAQIRGKYGSTIQKADALFSHKKNEMEHNKSKVVMNLALAEAFRAKYLNIDHRGEQRGATGPSDLTQQLLQSQFDSRSGSPATLDPQTASLPSAQFDRRLSSPATLDPQTASLPPAQDVNHSTLQSNNMPATLLHRSDTPPSTGDLVIGNEVSVPPPIIGSFTPSMPVSSTLVRGIGSMSQGLKNTTLKSQPLPPLPLHPTGSHIGSHGSNTSARPMPLQLTSGSATQLLMNTMGRSVASSNAAALPPLPEIAQNFETLNLSEF